jgi:hypothetical protein
MKSNPKQQKPPGFPQNFRIASILSLEAKCVGFYFLGPKLLSKLSRPKLYYLPQVSVR